ncbi:MAG TPA: Smr/MutS family protein [Candidatus Limnocylindrales bacterium]|nr:Smr/MutS family protein [Candidatus Limnocylindrales bacterium]
MDARSQALLEFTLVRERLAAATGFPVSRRLAEALEPSADPVIVARGLSQTDEARAFLAAHPGVGIGTAVDIGPAVERADRGGRLEIDQLLGIQATLVAGARLAEALNAERRPLLHDLSRAIAPLPVLRGRLEQSLDAAGELLDSASPALGGLRRQVRLTYERLRTRLDQLVHSAEVGGALQEPIVTLRGGRYVVPVRAEARSRVRGIVHDQSGSGQTLFVEPLLAVELGNAWREAQLAVEVEEERILDELSGLVATQAQQLRSTLAALGDFDLWAAKARLAAELDAVRAETAEQPEVILLSARHPGLSGRVVPIDIRLGDGYRALVVTGPNTGGKTVALRTIGLLALMHQAGLHVPAATGSRLPVFRDVFADIGDEQSVAQSLSTFSGHLRSIVRIVEAAAPGCLVLLDELGAGTDPTEGSALAQALLDHFLRAGALVAATTHYAELKTYAHNTPEARNASVEFDLETLSPTYRLTIGLPGSSQAFAIAERLGLPPELVADARSRLSRSQQEFEQTLASIKAAQETAAAAVERARETEARAEASRQAAAVERARARRERDDAFMSARVEAERALAALREEIRGARAALGRETLTGERLDRLETGLEARLAAIPTPGRRGRAGGGSGGGHGSGEAASTAADDAAAWRVGQAARTEAGWAGRIVALDAERATLEAGQLRVAVPLAELRRPDDDVPRPAAPSGRRGAGMGPPVVVDRGPGSPATVASSLDLRGARVDEALDGLEAYLDRAALAGLARATIIHGHGSGALRDAVRERLSGHPLVSGWRPGERGEGGDGATIVTF